MTVIPNSNDVVPVRNQLLEIDLVNSSFSSSIDATATTGVGYTVDSTGGSSQTTTTSVSTTPSSPASSEKLNECILGSSLCQKNLPSFSARYLH